MTGADDRILEALEDGKDAGLALTPHVLAYNLEYTNSHVSRRLSKLVTAGLADRVDKGFYELTEFGEKYLHGELSADDIDLEDL